MSDVELCGRAELAGFRWPDGSAEERALLTPLMEEGVRPYVANVETKMMLLRVGAVVLPVTVNDRDYENSYVCSPYTAVISYPLTELSKIGSRAVRWSLAALIRCVAPLLRAARVNKVVSVNNWLLSTNLYPAWDGDGVEQAGETLRRHFPDRVVMFRSLNDVTNGPLCRRLTEAGYLLVPSRQVYLFDGAKPDYLRRPNCRWDLKLLERTGYQVAAHEALTDEDDREAVRLYELLYLKKYSRHNPWFTERLVRLWRQRRLLQMWGLRDPDGRLDGVVGCFCRAGVMTVPLVGYDTALPQKVGLYRMLMAIVLGEAARRAMLLNLSSGASGFKRLRGGSAHIEYSAVYCGHLPRFRRGVWRALAALLTRVGVRTLKEYKL